MRIIVTDRTTGKVVAKDEGEIMVAQLRQKMLKKGIDIISPQYQMVTQNIDAELAQKRAEAVRRNEVREEIKTDVDSITDPIVKKILTRIIGDFYKGEILCTTSMLKSEKI